MSSPNDYELEIAPLAQLDIEDILQYTQETYGAKQRQIYSDDIKKALKNIKANPELGHSRDDIESRHKAWNVNQHTIVYDIKGRIISVFRILHGRMDFKRQNP